MAKRTVRFLRKTGSEKSVRERKAFAKKIRDARKRDLRSAHGEKYVIPKSQVERRKLKPYKFAGDYYRARRLFSEGVLGTRIPDAIGAFLKSKAMVRVLDVGSAKGAYWKPLLSSFGGRAERIELHSLNVSNYFRAGIPAKPERQHVGAVETKDVSKLGRFDVITSFYSFGHSSSEFLQTFSKVLRSLSKNGKFFAVFDHKRAPKDLDEKLLKSALGKSCRLDFVRLGLKKKRRTYNNAIVVTRLK